MRLCADAARMPHGRRRYLRRLGGLAVPVALAGCTEEGPADADPDGTVTTATGTTVADTETTAGAQATYPGYDWGKLAGVDAVATTTITMSGFEFVPLVATMRPGETVRVTNEDSSSHTITIPALDVDATLGDGGATTFTPSMAGTFDYVCEFHGPGMLGRLVVSEDAPTPTGTTTDGTSGTDTDGGMGTDTPTASPTPTPSPTDTRTESDGGYT